MGFQRRSNRKWGLGCCKRFKRRSRGLRAFHVFQVSNGFSGFQGALQGCSKRIGVLRLHVASGAFQRFSRCFIVFVISVAFQGFQVVSMVFQEYSRNYMGVVERIQGDLREFHKGPRCSKELRTLSEEFQRVLKRCSGRTFNTTKILLEPFLKFPEGALICLRNTPKT